MCRKMTFPACLILVLGAVNIALSATDPSPADGAIHPYTWVILSWSPRAGAVSHDVYLSNNFDDVNAGAEAAFQGNQPSTFFVVGFPGFAYPDGLIPGTTYYWRIDDVEADGVTIHPGDVFSFTIAPKQVFHPVPHHFKIGDLGRYDDGSCRRADSNNCTDWAPQGIYPACIPAAKASLYSAFQLLLPEEQRRWHMGTPRNHNPSPDEDGDFFSTMSVGAMRDNKPSRLEHWLSGEQIELVTIQFDLSDYISVEERAVNIDEAVKRYVGGTDGISVVALKPRPLYIQHRGHGWIIVGVEKDGFWSHAQNPESAGLSDWCTWENAPWRNSGTGEHNQPWFQIIYPLNCSLKPREKRLGSFSMWGSGGNANNIQFVDLPGGNSIDWTPNFRASSEGVGYVWIEDNVPLNRDGIPITRIEGVWYDDLGQCVPVPAIDFDECPCSNQEGCSQCRLRLHLPFWVHNTTKDELHRYRIDLKFWNKDGRWVSHEAKLMQPLDDGTTYPGFPRPYHGYYSMPGPRPREVFEIQAQPDETDRAGGRHPYSWQPVGWYIDFHKDQLTYYSIHGIKLILNCADVNPELNCYVQDVVQIWFRTMTEEVY